MTEKKTSKLAIASFILSVIPFLIIIKPELFETISIVKFLPAILFYIPLAGSFILGILAIIKIRKNKSSKGFLWAILGLTMSTITIIVTIIFLVLLAKTLQDF